MTEHHYDMKYVSFKDTDWDRQTEDKKTGTSRETHNTFTDFTGRYEMAQK